jgi:PGF-pre-PGF domain-containing protein
MKLLESVEADADAEFEFAEADTLKIDKVTITTKVGLSFMAITIKDGELPSGASAPFTNDTGGVYKYIELTKDFFTQDNITGAKIDFKVEVSWVTSNDVDKDSISLFRYDGTSWEMLDTSLVSKDSTYYYYEANTTNLSVFAIGGPKTAVSGSDGSEDDTTGLKGLSKFTLPQIIIIVGIIVASVMLLMMKLGVLEITTTKTVRPKVKRWKDVQQKYTKGSEQPKKENKKETKKE